MEPDILSPLDTLLHNAFRTNLFSRGFIPSAFVKDPFTESWNIRPLWIPDETYTTQTIKLTVFLNELLKNKEARTTIISLKPVCFLLSSDRVEIGVQMQGYEPTSRWFYQTSDGFGITTQ